MSVANMKENETVKDALKEVLTDVAEKDETSYNFVRQLTYLETENLDFPKLFAKTLLSSS